MWQIQLINGTPRTKHEQWLLRQEKELIQTCFLINKVDSISEEVSKDPYFVGSRIVSATYSNLNNFKYVPTYLLLKQEQLKYPLICRCNSTRLFLADQDWCSFGEATTRFIDFDSLKKVIETLDINVTVYSDLTQ